MSEQVEEQRMELAIKNQSITDSLHYAQRIIDALMPSQKFFKRVFPESFIFFRPKDIVSGDFYWIEQVDNYIFVAAVDCTGHGVPGAFMSIIGFDLLRSITLDQGLIHPDEILNKLNVEVAKTFKRESGKEAVKDGMDLSLCVIDRLEKKLEFAGAFNPLYLLRDGNLIEIEANRFSVGLKEDSLEKNFVRKEIDLHENDMLYLFSDGYCDQFGGPSFKKFKFRRFRHLLVTIHKYSIDKQIETINSVFDKWKGNLEQVDDVLLMGINPLATRSEQ